MMFDRFCGLTATNGSSSLFTQLISPGNMSAETSHDANGLVLDAWLTEVVVYGPAEATPTGSRISRAATAAANRMPFLIASSLKWDPLDDPSDRVRKCQACTRSRTRRQPRPCSGGRWATGRRPELVEREKRDE